MTLLPQLLATPLTCEIAMKTMLLLLKVHHGPITSDTSKIRLLEKIQNSALDAVTTFRVIILLISGIAFGEFFFNLVILKNFLNSLYLFYFKDLIGVNLHGLMYIQKEIEKKEGILLFKDVSDQFKEKQHKKKRKEKLKKAAAILTL